LDLSVIIERLLEALGIEAKREGLNRVATCPFPDHDDRHPSFKVRDQPGNPRHGLYVCSCGRGGSPRTLAHDLAGIDWESVDAWLEENAGDGEPDGVEETAGFEHHDTMGHKAFRMAPGVYFRPLEKWPGPARDYALRRGITPQQAERWGIGYAVDGRLAGRIVMPVRGEDGELQSYMARAFDGSERRYLTPKGEENPRPGACFGAERWGAERGTVVLCEGALKALAAERAGAGAVAAIGGSVLQPDHVALLSGFERLVVLPDADEAGEGVAAQAWAALARWRPVVKVELGRDADEVPEEELRGRLAEALA